jgi:hypothetical protein
MTLCDTLTIKVAFENVRLKKKLIYEPANAVVNGWPAGC